MKAYSILWLLVGILFGLNKGSDDVTTEAPTGENTTQDTNDRMELNIFKIFALVHKLNHEVVMKQVALASCQREFVDLEEVTEVDSQDPAVSSDNMALEMSESVPDQIPATTLEVSVPIQMPSEALINKEQQSDNDVLETQGVDIPIQLPEQDTIIDNSSVDGQPIQLPSVPVEVVTAEGTIQNKIRKRHERMPRLFEFIMNSLVRRYVFYDEAVTQCESAVSQLRNQDMATISPEISITPVTSSSAPSTSTTAP
ncbi:hypothetical protein LOTGIDRAFT_232975, partial [Lottia gigantea]